MTLGEKIKKLREEKKLSQVEFGKKIKISPKHIIKYENDKVIPGSDTLRRIAETLEVSSDYLLFNNVPKDGKRDIDDITLFEMFRTVETMDDKDKETIKNLISAMIAKRRMAEVLAK